MPDPTTLPALERNWSGCALLHVTLVCEEKDIPEILALVDRCHAGNAKVGDA